MYIYLDSKEILVFFFKQKTAYEIMPSLVGSEMCIRDRVKIEDNGKGMPEETVTILNQPDYHREDHFGIENVRKRLRLYYGEAASVLFESRPSEYTRVTFCLLYTSDAADDLPCGDFGGRRIIKKKQTVGV